MLVPGGHQLCVTMQAAATGTGNGTDIEVGGTSDGGFTVLDMHVEGINGDTITFRGTIDGTNYIDLQCENLNNSISGTTATADGIYRFVVGGVQSFRAAVTTYSAGTITVTGVATA